MLLSEAKEAWFTNLLSLKNGIPSHNTFGNVFSLINTEEFCHCFSRWVDDLRQLSKLDIISIDGGHGRIEQRTVRASSDIEWLNERHPHWCGLRSIVAVTAQKITMVKKATKRVIL
ncbi:MAG: transposase family protein [Mariprofundaceae bacterium]